MNDVGIMSSRLPSEQIVEKVAARRGVDPTSLTAPLFDVVDPDALNRLVASSSGEESGVEITFSYAGYEVTVAATGAVTLAER